MNLDKLAEDVEQLIADVIATAEPKNTTVQLEAKAKISAELDRLINAYDIFRQEVDTIVPSTGLETLTSTLDDLKDKLVSAQTALGGEMVAAGAEAGSEVIDVVDTIEPEVQPELADDTDLVDYLDVNFDDEAELSIEPTDLPDVEDASTETEEEPKKDDGEDEETPEDKSEED
jgi:hypothetical protein